MPFVMHWQLGGFASFQVDIIGDPQALSRQSHSAIKAVGFVKGIIPVSCGTVGFLTPRLTAEHYISEPQLSISDKIIGLNSLALYLLFIYLERKDARCSLLCPESSIQRSVLDRLGNVLGFDRFSSFQVGNSSGYFENSIVGAGSQPLLGHSPL